MPTPALLVIATLSIVVTSVLVYRDATRLGVAYPLLWAAVVFWTATLGVSLVLLLPSVPVPGALVVVLVGPALYLFERDDAKHGDEPADPRLLPDAAPPREDSDTDRTRSGENDEHGTIGDEERGDGRDERAE